jgi:hypothetical protein
MLYSEETLTLIRQARQLHAQGARDRWIKRLDLPRTGAVNA